MNWVPTLLTEAIIDVKYRIVQSERPDAFWLLIIFTTDFNTNKIEDWQNKYDTKNSHPQACAEGFEEIFPIHVALLWATNEHVGPVIIKYRHNY